MSTGVVERWVEALRSGKYAQTTKFLRVGDGYCCLGVLCDIKGDADWEAMSYGTTESGQTVPLGEDGGAPVHISRGCETMPPNEVMEWADLGDGAAERLANLNDNGKSFAEIADEIERMYAAGDNEDSNDY